MLLTSVQAWIPRSWLSSAVPMRWWHLSSTDRQMRVSGGSNWCQLSARYEDAVFCCLRRFVTSNVVPLKWRFSTYKWKYLQVRRRIESDASWCVNPLTYAGLSGSIFICMTLSVKRKCSYFSILNLDEHSKLIPQQQLFLPNFRQGLLRAGVSSSSCLLCFPECPAGTWGINCREQCHCSDTATCNPVNGKCVCLPGWRGKNCELRMYCS